MIRAQATGFTGVGGERHTVRILGDEVQAGCSYERGRIPVLSWC